jgi:hypothetical protein
MGYHSVGRAMLTLSTRRGPIKFVVLDPNTPGISIYTGDYLHDHRTDLFLRASYWNWKTHEGSVEINEHTFADLVDWLLSEKKS